MVWTACGKGMSMPALVGSKEVPVSILQYADESFFIGQAFDENRATLKSILGYLELYFETQDKFSRKVLSLVPNYI